MKNKHKEENIELEQSENNPFKQESQEEIEKENLEEIKKEDDYEKKYQELNNQYIRLSADFDNYRKRQAQEREALLKYGAEDTLKKFLPVLDTLERAKQSVEQTQDINVVKESYEIVSKQFTEALEKAGLKVIDEKGIEFDPNLHEAVMQTPTSEQPENTISEVLTKGYRLEDKVLRPALVNVSVSE